MGRLFITVTASQRVSMGHGSGKAFHTRAHAHVPGSVWRGAVARAWLDRYGTTDDVFREVFDRSVRFGPLFAAGTDLQPLSVRTCKYGPGHCRVSSWDAAFPPPADAGLPPDWTAGHWETGRGEVVSTGRSPLTVITSTGIDHATGTAAQSQLFSRDAVETGTRFTGYVVGPGDALDLLDKALVDLERIELGGRSSVLGGATLTATPADDDVPPAQARVAVRVLSPTFLVDDAGRPTLDVVGHLQRAGVRGRVTGEWTRPATEGTGGFHAASRLPKPVDVGLAAGSTVALDPASGDLPVLSSLAATGIGLRRPEGFGWVRIDTTAWTPPDTGAVQQAADTGSAYQQLVSELRALRLSPTHVRWVAAVLREDLRTDQDRRAVLARPGAAGLTEHQRTVIDTALALSRDRRDKLATELTTPPTPGGHR